MAVLVVGAFGAPTQAASAQAAGWIPIGHYTNKSRCVDVGTQYARESFGAYECRWIAASGVRSLWVR